MKDIIEDLCNKYDFDYSLFTEQEELFTEDYSVILDKNISELIKLIKSLDSKDNLQKTVLVTAILEIRSQIKKTQIQNSDIQRQNEKNTRSIEQKIEKLEDDIKHISRSVDFILKVLSDRHKLS